MRPTQLKKKKLEKKLNCIGFMGFGSGYGMGKGWSTSNGAVYCGLCPSRDQCWARHKFRVAGLVPYLTQEFERLAKNLLGPELVKKWYDLYQCLDPYTLVMTGNLEDGIRVAQGSQPKDRGPSTLSWPLQERIQ